MSATTETVEPILNPGLERLAQAAEFEDQAEPAAFEPVGEAEQVEIDQEQAARRCAAGLIHGMAFGVKQVWQVEYSEDTKAEGIEKLTPCFEGDGTMPQWLVDALGKYGKYLEAGAWFAGVGLGTYQAVQARKAEEEANASARSVGTLTEAPAPRATATAATGAGFGSAGD